MDLHEAAAAGDVERVRELLDGGTDVDALDEPENTPLHRACFSEEHHPDVVALLRERGADPERRNIYGETPRTKAYERFLLSGFDPLEDLPAPDVPQPEHDLTEDEMALIVDAVDAIVAQDRERLETMGAYEGAADPYDELSDYGYFGDVELIPPPGDPATWEIRSYRGDGVPGVNVEIGMWTRQEGRSDLTLQLDLDGPDAESLKARFKSLHVM
jgi:hypothetical protein